MEPWQPSRENRIPCNYQSSRLSIKTRHDRYECEGWCEGESEYKVYGRLHGPISRARAEGMVGVEADGAEEGTQWGAEGGQPHV